MLTKKSELNLKYKAYSHKSAYMYSYKARILYCVKRSLLKSRLIKLFTRALWSQSHTNNEFLKLVEALPGP